MYELLMRLWVEGRMSESRVRAALAASVSKGFLTQEQSDEIQLMSRNTT